MVLQDSVSQWWKYMREGENCILCQTSYNTHSPESIWRPHIYIYTHHPNNTHTPSGSNRCEGSREKASFPFFLPGRAVNGNGIPIPWSLLLIHNRPTAGLLGTSADMPASAHTCTHTRVQTHVHTHLRTWTHISAWPHLCQPRNMCNIHSHACTSVVMHTNMDGNTHTHTLNVYTKTDKSHT